MVLWRASDRQPIDIDLSRRLGSGGEGEVFALAELPLVAKCYRRMDRSDSERQARKLGAMIANPPLDPERVNGALGLAWPLDLLYARNGVLAGFIMPRLRLEQAQPLITLCNAAARRQRWPGVTWRQSVRAGIRLSALIDSVHRQHYVIGDVSEVNSMVTHDGHAALLDCDSFGFETAGEVFSCPVGRPGFLAPELQGVTLTQVRRTPAQDRFALAVLLYRLLQEGEHPFATASSGAVAPVERNIASGAYAHSPGCAPRQLAPPLALLPEGLQRLFEQAFVVGHQQPDERPTPADWRHALGRLEQSLVKCATNAWHVYSNHLTGCPWCVRASRLGVDAWTAEGRSASSFNSRPP